MSYVGETPIKKFARMAFWLKARRFAEDFGNRKCVFLASSECGDASTLHAMGVPWDKMIAVDIDADAVGNARRRYPKLRVEHCAASELLRAWPDLLPPAVVFLDFCAQLSAPIEAETVACMNDDLMSQETVFGVNLLKGREGAHGKRRMARMKGVTLRAQTDVTFGAIRVGNKDTPLGAAGPDTKALIRHMALLLCLRPRTWSIVDTFEYRTSSPMAVGIYIPRETSGAKVSAANRIFPRFSTLASQTNATVRDLAVWLDEREVVRSFFRQCPPEARDSYILEGVKADPDSGIWWEISANDWDVAGLLNIPRTTLAAWKAHATRGTYSAA